MKTVKLGEAKTPENTRIYAIGDVHGHLELLENLHEQIKSNLKQHPIGTYKIIFLGDYIDRGPNSMACIDFLIKAQQEDPNVICLKGNHEEKFENFLADPLKTANSFLTYGGVECAASYGVKLTYGDMTDDEIIEKAQKLKDNVPIEHLTFFSFLKKSITFGDYFFVHAGVRPGVPLDQQSDQDLIWIRSDFIPHRGLYEKVIVHGHTPHYPIEIEPNRINADTCAYDTGVLTCVILENDNYRLLTTEQ